MNFKKEETQKARILTWKFTQKLNNQTVCWLRLAYWMVCRLSQIVNWKITISVIMFCSKNVYPALVVEFSISLQWRHNGRDDVSNHQPHHCLLNRVFRCRWKKTSKLRVTGLCAENSPVTGEFPAHMASNAENVSIWWRHHIPRSTSRSSYRCYRWDSWETVLSLYRFSIERPPVANVRATALTPYHPLKPLQPTWGSSIIGWNILMNEVSCSQPIKWWCNIIIVRVMPGVRWPPTDHHMFR